MLGRIWAMGNFSQQEGVRNRSKFSVAFTLVGRAARRRAVFIYDKIVGGYSMKGVKLRYFKESI